MELPYLSVKIGQWDYLLMGDVMLYGVYSASRGETPLCHENQTISTLNQNLKDHYSKGLPLENVILMIGTKDLCLPNASAINAYSEGARITHKLDELRETLQTYKLKRLVIIAIPIMPRYEQLTGFHTLWCVVNSYIENNFYKLLKRDMPTTEFLYYNLVGILETQAVDLVNRIPVLPKFQMTYPHSHELDMIKFSELGVRSVWNYLYNELRYT